MNNTNISIYFSEAQFNQVRRAAERAGKSISAYGRDIVSQWAASDLSARPAPSPTERPPAPQSAIVQTARMHGMKVTDYRRYTAEMQAREELGLPKLAPSSLPPAGSGRATIIPPPKRGRPPKRTASGQFRRVG